MWAMRNEEGVLIMMVLFGAISFWVWISHRAGLRKQRLEVIQKAIESGNLDDATRREVLDALGRDGRTGSEWSSELGRQLAFLARNLVFVAGWLTMFIGAGCWIAGGIFGWYRTDIQTAVIATFVGLALVTVPIALRELESRRLRDRG
jgi:hypothetical protein